jgi:hypothetical protein
MKFLKLCLMIYSTWHLNFNFIGEFNSEAINGRVMNGKTTGRAWIVLVLVALRRQHMDYAISSPSLELEHRANQNPSACDW